ncbi:MAG: hypothetical protein GF333_06100 [Candidatus Omnitrophica bacterium]|nr:hypothetical protein [Candidatus Omnitrophota bacterium]
MKQLTVIGGGNAGRNLIETVRAQHVSLPITLIDARPAVWENRSFIFADTFPAPLRLDRWAAGQRIEFICAPAVQVRPHRRKVVLKSGNTHEYGTLAVASGMQSRKEDLRGVHREGFSYLSDLNLLKVNDYLKISEEVCIEASTWQGIRWAFACARCKMRVRLVGKDFGFLGNSRELVFERCGQHRIEIYEGAALAEIIGEKMVKAVKLEPLKVLSAQIVIKDSGFEPATRFLPEGAETFGVFFTNLERVFCAGSVTGDDAAHRKFFFGQEEISGRQGRMLAEYLLNDTAPEWKEPEYPDPEACLREELERALPPRSEEAVQGAESGEREA